MVPPPAPVEGGGRSIWKFVASVGGVKGAGTLTVVSCRMPVACRNINDTAFGFSRNKSGLNVVVVMVLAEFLTVPATTVVPVLALDVFDRSLVRVSVDVALAPVAELVRLLVLVPVLSLFVVTDPSAFAVEPVVVEFVDWLIALLSVVLEEEPWVALALWTAPALSVAVWFSFLFWLLDRLSVAFWVDVSKTNLVNNGLNL